MTTFAAGDKDYIQKLNQLGTDGDAAVAAAQAAQAASESSASDAAASAASVVRDGSGGIAGLTGYAINLWNAAKTFKSLLTFTGTADRVHTFQDRDGTLLDDTDLSNITSSLSEKEVAADKDASGGYAGLTGYKLNLWNAAKTFKSLLAFSGTANRNHTLQDRDGTLLDDTDLSTVNSAITLKANAANAALTGTATAENLTISGDLSNTSTGANKLPAGTTAQRPTGVFGKLRGNTDTLKPEFYNGTSWGPVGGGAAGGGSNAVFVENDIHVTDNYTITTGKNASSAGPIIIDSGIVVTIPSGSVWTII